MRKFVGEGEALTPWPPLVDKLIPNPKLLTAKAPRTPRPEGLIGEDKRNF
jgi:glycine cleavage system pyridoxal-binding protein P